MHLVVIDVGLPALTLPPSPVTHFPRHTLIYCAVSQIFASEALDHPFVRDAVCVRARADSPLQRQAQDGDTAEREQAGQERQRQPPPPTSCSTVRYRSSRPGAQYERHVVAGAAYHDASIAPLAHPIAASVQCWDAHKHEYEHEHELEHEHRLTAQWSPWAASLGLGN